MRTMLLLSTIALMATSGWAEAKPASTAVQTIRVTGEATISVAPDQAEITIGVVSEAPVAQEAASTNSHRAQSVIQALRKKFGSKLDLKTSSYSLSPVYASKPPDQGTPVIRAYRATMLIELTVHEIDDLGATIDLAMHSGANFMQGLRFASADLRKLETQALQQAAASARADADSLASALNLKVIRVLSVTEGGAPAKPLEPGFRTLAAGVPIESGKLDVTAVVNMEAEMSSR